MRSDRSIKAIFFDLGGVIFQRDRMYGRVLEVLEPADSILFWDLYNAEAMPLCRGEIDKFHFFRNLAAKAGRQIPDEILHELCEERFHENRVVDAGVLASIESLRPDFKLGLISNITEEFADVARRMGIFALFDEVVLSYDVGQSKDDEQIFRIALGKLKVDPAEAVFIDDYQLYVEVARSAGMHGILFKDNITLRKDLAAIGIAV